MAQHVDAPSPAAGRGRLFVSPLARRLAASGGLDLTLVTGSGPRGRIVKRDVERALQAGVGSPVPEAKVVEPQVSHITSQTDTAPTPAPWQLVEATPHSNTRKTIARRLVEAKQTVPHFYLTVSVELDEVLALRQRLNADMDAGDKLSINDFVIKAAAVALQKVPAANAMWTNEAVLRFVTVDISVAVATDGGLITPIIRNADQKGLSAISAEMKTLAAKARAGKLMPEEFQGGGFSVSNLGMYGVEHFSAIINPPQSCILAVGAGEKRPVVKDGALAIASVMTVTLSVDHRSVDGAVGAEFLKVFKRLLQDPLRLML